MNKYNQNTGAHCKYCGSEISEEKYTGVLICRDCLSEHCLDTNCLGCNYGKYPNCPFLEMKRRHMRNEQNKQN
jgi:hypothetical protein